MQFTIKAVLLSLCATMVASSAINVEARDGDLEARQQGPGASCCSFIPGECKASCVSLQLSFIPYPSQIVKKILEMSWILSSDTTFD